MKTYTVFWYNHRYQKAFCTTYNAAATLAESIKEQQKLRNDTTFYSIKNVPSWHLNKLESVNWRFENEAT